MACLFRSCCLDRRSRLAPLNWQTVKTLAHAPVEENHADFRLGFRVVDDEFEWGGQKNWYRFDGLACNTLRNTKQELESVGDQVVARIRAEFR